MFRKLIKFFAKRWVLIAIGLIAVALLIWFVGPLIAIADYKPLDAGWVRIAVILAMPLIWLLSRFRLRLVDRKAQEKLKAELTDNARAGADKTQRSDPPDAEQAVLAERLKAAFQILDKAELSRGRKLYQLPWYVIIGAPGSGKTTALKCSGLNFPLQSKLGSDPVQGAGGTRYCDWWFTDEAVFIDTAGRYTTQDNPSEQAGRAWLGFLGMLKRSRPKRPLNGVLVTVSILDLLKKTPTQLGMQATAIKRRIQELNSHLGMELPVYVVFTKCDLLAGFSEFFQDLEAEDREQVWGVTLPLPPSGDPGAAVSAFPERFKALVVRARGRVAHRLHEERHARRRALIHEFPHQMLALGERLEAFLREVFVPNQFEQAALLRGVYFVSGTQTSAPAAWAGGVLPPALCAAPVSVATDSAPRTFFLTRLLREVIFAESELAVANRRVRQRFRWAYSASFAAVGVLFLASAAVWALSHSTNREYLNRVAEQVDAYETRFANPPDAQGWRDLAARLDMLRSLPTGFDDDGSWRPLEMSFGLYQGSKISAQARNTYLRVLERRLLPAVTDELLHQLGTFGDQEERLYESLRVYLMFYHPERLDPEAVQTWLAVTWDRTLPGEYNEAVRQSLERHLRVALRAALTPPPMDVAQVAQARETLLQTPLERRLYMRLRNRHIAEHGVGFSVSHVLGSRQADALFTRASGEPLAAGVPSFFTYSGFHRGFNLQKRRLTNHLASERWVYGEDHQESVGDEEMSRLGRELDRYYFTEYVEHWEAYLGDLRLNGFGSASEGRDRIRELAGGGAPIQQILEAVSEHTALSELPAGAETVGQIADAVSESALRHERRRVERLMPDGAGVGSVRLPGHQVDEAFRELNRFVTENEGGHLQRLQTALSSLSDYFEDLVEADDVRRMAFEATANPSGSAAALREVRVALSAAPRAVRNWFEPFADSSQQVTTAAARQYINQVWRTEVLSYYDRAIAGRYPLSSTAEREVRGDDFNTFFGPGGVLDGFFQTHIAPFADTGRGNWRWRRSVGLSNQTLRLFQRAHRIQEAYFVGPGEPRVDFTLRPTMLDGTVTRFMLETGDNEVVYAHGPPRTAAVSWRPGEHNRARLVFTLANRGTPLSTTADGDWSLFRLLDEHAVTEPIGSDALRVRFGLNGFSAEYELRPRRIENPFTNRELVNFSLPRQL